MDDNKEIKKDDIILLTAALRFDNLLYIAKTVQKYCYPWSQKFNIYWCICKDIHNGYGDISKVIEYLKKTYNINWLIYDVNNEKEKNYGGDLFNAPLIDLVNSYQLKNPWVYILDDDNLVHPNLFPTLNICKEHNYYNDKEVILLSIKFDEGNTKIICKTEVNIPDRINFITGNHIIDPSAVIIRYSVLEKHGFYSNERLYDFYWLRMLIDDELKSNNVIGFEDYFNGHGKNYTNAYHNGLNPLKDEAIINRYNDASQIVVDINIADIYNDGKFIGSTTIPIYSTALKQRILDIVRKEINNINTKDVLE